MVFEKHNRMLTELRLCFFLKLAGYFEKLPSLPHYFK